MQHASLDLDVMGDPAILHIQTQSWRGVVSVGGPDQALGRSQAQMCVCGHRLLCGDRPSDTASNPHQQLEASLSGKSRRPLPCPGQRLMTSVMLAALPQLPLCRASATAPLRLLQLLGRHEFHPGGIVMAALLRAVALTVSAAAAAGGAALDEDGLEGSEEEDGRLFNCGASTALALLQATSVLGHHPGAELVGQVRSGPTFCQQRHRMRTLDSVCDEQLADWASAVGRKDDPVFGDPVLVFGMDGQDVCHVAVLCREVQSTCACEM